MPRNPRPDQIGMGGRITPEYAIRVIGTASGPHPRAWTSCNPDGGLSSKTVIHEAVRPLPTHSAKEAPLVERYREAQLSAGLFCIYEDCPKPSHQLSPF